MSHHKKFWTFLDKQLSSYLISHREVIPHRLSKWIAIYYPDARIRKHYCSSIGVEMGEGTYANLGMKVIPNQKKICVHIGCNVSIGPNVVLLASIEPNNSEEMRQNPYVTEHLICNADIYIEDNVWLGANVTVFPGVTIGEFAIVGAGSVVRSDVPPYTIVAGLPAKFIRDIRTGKRIEKKK